MTNSQKKLKVKAEAINKGQKNQFFVLVAQGKAQGDNFVCHAPNNWKTARGALNWAKNNGYQPVTTAKTTRTTTQKKKTVSTQKERI